MRSPRVVYGVVAAVLAVAGFVLPRALADRSAPELGETVTVVPSSKPSPSATPSGSTGTPKPGATGTPEPGAGLVSPAPIRTAGDSDDDPGDGLDPDDPDDDD